MCKRPAGQKSEKVRLVLGNDNTGPLPQKNAALIEDKHPGQPTVAQIGKDAEQGIKKKKKTRGGGSARGETGAKLKTQIRQLPKVEEIKPTYKT